MPLDGTNILRTVIRMTKENNRGGWAGIVRRAAAAGCAALVLSLAVLSASPALHHWLHGDQDAGAGHDGCAVVLFANGVTEAAAVAVLAIAALCLLGEPVLAPAALVLREPRFQLPPGCGPPPA